MDANEVVTGLWQVKLGFVNAFLIDTGEGRSLNERAEHVRAVDHPGAQHRDVSPSHPLAIAFSEC